MARVLWQLRIAAFFPILVDRVAGHGLNRSGLQTLYCHECVPPFTLKICCQSNCERTLIVENEQLLIHLDKLVVTDVCESAVFFNETSPKIALGAVDLLAPTTVRS